MGIMKRKDMHPLVKFYDNIYFDTLDDYTRPSTIKVYRTTSKVGWNMKEKKEEQQIDKGEMLFEFQYEPLLKITEYEKLLTEYERSTTFQELYKIASLLYLELYRTAVKWFVEKSKSSFDFNTELEKYKYKLDDGFACPILKHLDNSRLGNSNIYQHIRNLMIKSEVKNIRSVNKLLYKPKTESNLSKFKYTDLGFLLVNAIANIAYYRFSLFLKEKQQSAKNPGVESSDLTVAKVALICFYKNRKITATNIPEIRKDFKLSSLGGHLYQDYCYYSKRGRRTSNTENKLLLENKIGLFESIIIHLNDNEKVLLLEDLAILRAYQK